MATKVVLVNDDKHVIDVVAKMLARRRYSLVSLRDGRHAVAEVEREMPDVVLLDVVLPGIDGASIAQEIRNNARTSDIPIVFLTDLVEAAETYRNGNRIGGNYFLAKPFDARQLFEVIDRALADD